MTNKTFYALGIGLIAASVIFWGFMFQTNSSADEATLIEAEEIEVTMYHSEGCQCCVKWAEYLEDHGADVTNKKLSDVYPVKEEKGVPRQLQSCHTAVVDGYVIEGHVPIEDIQRLLTERPDAIGLSAPGMPPNSPGMDQPVDNEYQIVLFDEESMTVYNTHN